MFSRLVLKFVLLVAWCFASVSYGNDLLRNVEFSWGEVEGAETYEVELKSTNNRIVKQKVKKSAWQGDLPAGIYKLRIRSFDRRKVPGGWSDPTTITVNYPPVKGVYPKEKTKFKATKSNKIKIPFRWQPIAADLRYRLEIKTKDEVVIDEEVGGNAHTVVLEGGKEYFWSLVAVAPDGLKAETWEKPRALKVLGARLTRPKITKPFSDEDLLVEWEGEGADYYYLRLQKYKDKKWRTIKKEKEYGEGAIKIEDPEKGKYRLLIAARSPNRATSKTTRYSFRYPMIKSRKKSKKAEKPGDHYLRAGYNYLPFLRKSTMVTDAGTGAVNELVLNSNGGDAKYRYFGTFIGYGIGMQAHLAKSSVFEDVGKDETSEQKAIKIDTLNYRGDIELLLNMWDLTFIGGLGGGQRQFPVFFRKSVDAVTGEVGQATEAESRWGILYRFTRTADVFADFVVAGGGGLKPSTLKDYLRTETTIGFAHSFLTPNLILRYLFLLETFSLKYGPDDLDQNYETSIRAIYLGGQVGFVF